MLLVVCKKSAYQIYVREHGSRQVADLLREGSPATASFLSSDEAHQRSMDQVFDWLNAHDVAYQRMWREEIRGPGGVSDAVTLVVTLGGDGTLLDASHHVGAQPMLGINSDPQASVGHLCAGPASKMDAILPPVLEGRRAPSIRRRIRVAIDDRQITTPVLNEVLVSHPNPAGTSRYRLAIGEATERQRSGGIWVCTATGSTGAALSAGGDRMNPAAAELQYVAREPMAPKQGCSREMVRGFLPDGQTLRVQWWKRQGRVFLDGPRLSHQVRMGETISLSADAPSLNLHARGGDQDVLS